MANFVFGKSERDTRHSFCPDCKEKCRSCRGCGFVFVCKCYPCHELVVFKDEVEVKTA